MIHNIIIGKIAESTDEYIIGSWLKDVDEMVRAEEPLIEIEVNKATMSIKAGFSGILVQKNFSEGEVVGPDDIVAEIESNS